MHARTRRAFLADVGRGMIVASLGTALAADCGLVMGADVEATDKRLTFGALEPLVAWLQETSPDKLLPQAVEKIKAGLDLKTLTAAASLANARTFGGEHYGAFHAFMALAPAYHMAQELPTERQPLPVLKVLYRMVTMIQASGGSSKEVLHRLAASEEKVDSRAVRAAINAGDASLAERRLAALLKQQSIQAAFEAALEGVEDNHDVHTVVLPWRAWAALEFTGREHAETLLRQSVRKCAQQAAPQNEARQKDLARRRAIVPNLLEKHRLLAFQPGTKTPDDAMLEKLAADIFVSSDEQAAGVMAQALADGYAPGKLIDAVSLASNALLLRQVENAPGNYGRRTHGDSMGVHASDTTNAWRNMLRVCNPQHQAAGLMLAAANVAGSVGWGSGKSVAMLQERPYPTDEQLAAITATDGKALLAQLDGAIRESNQLAACAIATKYGAQGGELRPIMDVLLTYATSEDGRLHAEKYYRTVSEEFAALPAAFRWRQIAALARVTSSQYGLDAKDKPAGRAPGYEEACTLLGVS